MSFGLFQGEEHFPL